MIRARTVAWMAGACLAACVAAPVQASDLPWRELKTERYTVLSQLSDRDTRGWAEEYDEFIATVLEITHFRPRSLPPLTVVLFKRDRDFAAFKPPRPDGRRADNVAGFFLRRETWGVIGLAETADTESTRHLIFHEGVHWITSADPAPQPTWFSEGLAESFSTFGRKVEKVHLADPISTHVELLRATSLLPMGPFLTQQGSLFDRDSHTDLYYAQAWALVHFLLFSGDPERRDQLTRYLTAYRKQSAEASAQVAFGPDLQGLSDALGRYIKQSSMHILLLPLHKAPPPPAIVDAPPVEVEVALAKLALWATDTTLADSHAARAAALAPDAPAVHELKTYLALRAKDHDTALLEARRALQAGSQDAAMFLLAAEALQETGYGSAEERAQRQADLCEQAILLRPTLLEAYEHLVAAVAQMQMPAPQELTFLKGGMQIFPQEPALGIGLAAAQYKLGQREAAFAALDVALTDERLGGADRKYARQLRSSWRLAELHEQVEPLMRGQKYPEALKVVDSYEGKLDADDARETLAPLRELIDLQMAVRAAADAQRAGHGTDARQQYEALLARPDLPSDLRINLTRALDALKRAH